MGRGYPSHRTICLGRRLGLLCGKKATVWETDDDFELSSGNDARRSSSASRACILRSSNSITHGTPRPAILVVRPVTDGGADDPDYSGKTSSLGRRLVPVTPRCYRASTRASWHCEIRPSALATHASRRPSTTVGLGRTRRAAVSVNSQLDLYRIFICSCVDFNICSVWSVFHPCTVADPGFANGGPRPSAAGASIEAPKAPWGIAPPQKIFRF